LKKAAKVFAAQLTKARLTGFATVETSESISFHFKHPSFSVVVVESRKGYDSGLDGNVQVITPALVHNGDAVQSTKDYLKLLRG
jgi:hypothetical protein